MEGKQGTIIDMGAKTPVTIRGGGVDGEISVTINRNETTQLASSPTTNSANKQPEEGRVTDFATRTTKPLDIGAQSSDRQQEPKGEQKPDSEKTAEELLAEKREKVEELFEQLGERLDPKTKEKLMDEYLDGVLHDDEQKEGNNLEDTFAEIKRLLTLLIALFLMIIVNPDKTHFTGKDLGLEEKAPEGESNDVLSKMMNGRTLQDSWNGFKKEVERIEEPVPFGEFMSRVLAANERHSVKSFKVKNKEGSGGSSLAMNKKKGFFGRMVGFVRRTASVRSR